jgi:hypothetical protein
VEAIAASGAISQANAAAMGHSLQTHDTAYSAFNSQRELLDPTGRILSYLSGLMSVVCCNRVGSRMYSWKDGNHHREFVMNGESFCAGLLESDEEIVLGFQDSFNLSDWRTLELPQAMARILGFNSPSLILLHTGSGKSLVPSLCAHAAGDDGFVVIVTMLKVLTSECAKSMRKFFGGAGQVVEYKGSKSMSVDEARRCRIIVVLVDRFVEGDCHDYLVKVSITCAR